MQTEANPKNMEFDDTILSSRESAVSVHADKMKGPGFVGV
jgi:hypothetical protein